jgi:hypothetical protein
MSSPDNLVCFIYGRAVNNSRDLVFINEPVDCSTAIKYQVTRVKEDCTLSTIAIQREINTTWTWQRAEPQSILVGRDSAQRVILSDPGYKRDTNSL